MRLAVLLLLLSATLLAKQVGPRSWTLTTFRDSSTGASFQYPAALRATKNISGNFSPALTQMKGLTFRAKLAYAPPSPYPGPHEIVTDLHQLDFLYATAPAKSASACYGLTKNWSVHEPASTSLSVHGVIFAVGSYADAGAGQSIDGTIYAAFRDNTCFLFEQDTVGGDYVGDVTQAEGKDFSRHLSAIIQTVRFAPLIPVP